MYDELIIDEAQDILLRAISLISFDLSLLRVVWSSGDGRSVTLRKQSHL